MSRKNRLHYENALYHVMVRGNFRQALFSDDRSYNYFYDLFKRSVEKYRCKIHLFCLMTNHIHIVIQVNGIPISKIMQSLEATYAGFYNKKLQRQGHLFQGRFKAKHIWDRRYFIELIFYIHNNPIAANLVTDLDHYPWSSHHVYARRSSIEWLTTDLVVELITKNTLFSSYNEFMESYKSEFSNDNFESDFERKVTMIDSFENYFETNLPLDLSMYSIKEIIKTICTELDMPQENISSASLKSEFCEIRSVISYFAHYHAGHTLRAISCFLERDADNLSKTMHRHLSKGKLDASIKRLTYAFKQKIIIEQN